MATKSSLWLVLIPFLIAQAAYSESRGVVGPEITYQGELTEAGSPASGLFDFEFRLFDSPAGAVQLGSTVSLSGITVSEGIFTVPLNFGPVFETADEAWIEVRVREAGGGGTYTSLFPRQPVTAAPYALTATSVLPNSIGGAEINPAEVQARVFGTCGPQSFATGVGLNGSLVCESSLDSGYWQGGVSSSIHYLPGRIGIRTSSPEYDVHLNGDFFINSSQGAFLLGFPNNGNQWRMSTLGLGETLLFRSKPDGGSSFTNRMSINGTSGNVVIGQDAGTTNQYTLKVDHGGFGLAIARAGTSNVWEFLTSSATAGNLSLYGNGSIRGVFSGTDGSYAALSDRRFKTDIVALDNVLDRVLSLEPSRYSMAGADPLQQSSIGFIAQDVEPLFPELVQRFDDERSTAVGLNYGGVSVLAIKAIQEQQALIEDLQRVIDRLEARVLQLEQQPGR